MSWHAVKINHSVYRFGKAKYFVFCFFFNLQNKKKYLFGSFKNLFCKQIKQKNFFSWGDILKILKKMVQVYVELAEIPVYMG